LTFSFLNRRCGAVGPALYAAVVSVELDIAPAAYSTKNSTR